MCKVTREQGIRAALIAVLMIGLVAFLLRRGKDTSPEAGEVGRSPVALARQTLRSEAPAVESPVRGDDGKSDAAQAEETASSLEQAGVDLPPLPPLYSMMSKLSENEQEEAYSVMEQEFSTWQALRTVAADIEIKDGPIDPTKGFMYDGVAKARLAFEVVPHQEKVGPTRATIRICLENGDGVVILHESLYGDDPPMIWRKDGRPPSLADVYNISKVYDTLNLEETFAFPVVRCHDDFAEYQKRMEESRQIRKAFPNAQAAQAIAEHTRMDDLIPIRRSSPKETAELFHGENHYLFGIADGEAQYWLRTTTGELSAYSNPHENAHRIVGASGVDPRRTVRFEKYVQSEEGNARFPSQITYETIGLLAPGKPARFRDEVNLSNVTVNGSLPSTMFKAPPGAIPYER